MRVATLVGIVLIVLGALALVFEGFSYQDRDSVDLGVAKVTAKHEKHVPIPPILGGLAIAGGLVLVVWGVKGKQ
jgi:hypothetical protein